MDDALYDLELRIGHHFRDPALLDAALTHSSCLGAGGAPEAGDQRLEFLGDAVLGMVIAERLFAADPPLREDAMTRLRAHCVEGRNLCGKARNLELDRLLRIGNAEHARVGGPTDAMLEDALEALVGALYLDGGLETVRSFVVREFADDLDNPPAEAAAGSPKNRLQEWSQQRLDGELPHYETTMVEGPDHARLYTVTVSLDGRALGNGSGSSKKEAESRAAAEALEALGGDGSDEACPR